MRNWMVLGACALFVGAGAAHASIPGNIDERSTNGLRHVCIDNEPGDVDYIICEEQLPVFGEPYSGVECAAEGLPPICELDFVPKVKIKGTVTIIYDENPKDAADNEVDEQTGLVLKLKVKTKQERFYDLFLDSKLGNWNRPGTEAGLLAGNIQFTNPGMTAFQFANGNLRDLGEKVVSVVDAAYGNKDLSETLPVITSMERLQDDDASGDDPTASATTWTVTLEFARVRD